MNRRLDHDLQLHDRMVADTRCAIDGKFHSVLVRRCIQLRQLLTAVDVVRAAYHLLGGALSSRPRPVGTEPRTLKELVRKLKISSQEDSTGVSTFTTNCHTREKFRGEGPQPWPLKFMDGVMRHLLVVDVMSSRILANMRCPVARLFPSARFRVAALSVLSSRKVRTVRGV